MNYGYVCWPDQKIRSNDRFKNGLEMLVVYDELD